MSLFKSDIGQRKYNLSIFVTTLAFILALFGQLTPVVAKCLLGLFTIAVGGNVGAKIAKVLPSLFNKREI